MTWTHKTPTAPGAYWWRIIPLAVPVLIDVQRRPLWTRSWDKTAKGVLHARLAGTDNWELIGEGGEWHPCLPPPVDGITLHGGRLDETEAEVRRQLEVEVFDDVDDDGALCGVHPDGGVVVLRHYEQEVLDLVAEVRRLRGARLTDNDKET